MNFFQIMNHNLLFYNCNSFHSFQIFRINIAIIDSNPVLTRLLSDSDCRFLGSDQILDQIKNHRILRSDLDPCSDFVIKVKIQTRRSGSEPIYVKILIRGSEI